jgi:hypothetical protein
MSGTTSRRLAGIAEVTIDGDSWDIVGDLEYSTSRATRETLKGQTRVEGYSEMPNQGYLSMKLRDRSDQTVQSLNAKTSATIIAAAANGKTIYGAGMWQTGEIAVNTMEGSFSIRFDGDNVQEATV